MTVINTQAQTAAISPNPEISTTGIANITPPMAAIKSNNGAQDTTVNLSGHAMLLSRIFNTTDMNTDIPVLYTLTADNAGRLSSFLTKDDRKMLESAYQYASENGMDPRYVDDLAHDLAWYRQSPNDKGPLYDTGGHRLTFEFSATDTIVMDRIKNGNAINQTTIDRGFVDYVFNPLVPGHSVNFQFLEKMISKLSTSPDKTPAASGNDTLPSFTSYVPPKDDYITHVSAQAKVFIPRPGEWGKATSGSGNGADLLQLLTASNKIMLSQAFLSVLAQRPEEASARLENIASLLDLSLTNPGGGKAAPDSANSGLLLEVINNLNHFLDHNSSQNPFDANSFLRQLFNQKIDTSA
jgi:hypothetical protein